MCGAATMVHIDWPFANVREPNYEAANENESSIRKSGANPAGWNVFGPFPETGRQPSCLELDTFPKVTFVGFRDCPGDASEAATDFRP